MLSHPWSGSGSYHDSVGKIQNTSKLDLLFSEPVIHSLHFGRTKCQEKDQQERIILDFQTKNHDEEIKKLRIRRTSGKQTRREDKGRKNKPRKARSLDLSDPWTWTWTWLDLCVSVCCDSAHWVTPCPAPLHSPASVSKATPHPPPPPPPPPPSQVTTSHSQSLIAAIPVGTNAILVLTPRSPHLLKGIARKQKRCENGRRADSQGQIGIESWQRQRQWQWQWQWQWKLEIEIKVTDAPQVKNRLLHVQIETKEVRRGDAHVHGVQPPRTAMRIQATHVVEQQ